MWGFMFFGTYLSPLISPERWSEIHKIHIFIEKCSCCGRLLKVNKPFATKELRGFLSGPCECGNLQTPFNFIFKDEENG